MLEVDSCWKVGCALFPSDLNGLKQLEEAIKHIRLTSYTTHILLELKRL